MNLSRVVLAAVIACALSTSASRADEPVASRESWLGKGYQPAPAAKALAQSADIPYAAHSLAWPIDFASTEKTIGNVMAQYQPFSSPPYFHGGLDLLTTTRSELHTPIAGKLEAGHYGYSTNADGSMTKFWTPWPGRGDALYFELAVVSTEGVRFEFHHVDRARLPSTIVSQLNRGGGSVAAGTLLGYAVAFGRGYDHIHYNVIQPDGTRINPEHLSPLVPDRRAPSVQAAVAVLPSGATVSIDQPLRERPTEFVVAVLDQFDEGPYEHPPTLARLIFASGESTSWDFTSTLTGPDGKFPNLSSYFMKRVSLPGGRSLSTSGGYGTGLSLVRLKMPPAATGSFDIELSDAAGNTTRVSGRVEAR